MERLDPLVHLIYLRGLLPQLLILKLEVFDPVASFLGFLLECLILNLHALNRIKLLRVSIFAIERSTASMMSWFDNHRAVVKLFLALLEKLEPLAQVSNRGLVLIVPILLLSQRVELVSSTDVHRVVAVRHVRLLQSGADHVR